MEGKRLLRTLRLTNVLSYGPEGVEIELQPLNVLIGPNGSGKSNLIEALALLKAAPTDLAAPIRAGGGIAEWPWKGGTQETSRARDLTIEATLNYPPRGMPVRYRLQLARVGYQLELSDEVIENVEKTHCNARDVFFYYRYQKGRPVLSVCREHQTPGDQHGSYQRELNREDIDPYQSILSQRKDPDLYPEVTYVGKVFSQIGLFRVPNLGPGSVVRGPQAADEPSSFLLEDGRNLGMVLNDLLSRPLTKRLLVEKLKEFCEYVEDIGTKVHAGTVETPFHERGLLDATPSMRLSDGALRYLCLVAILCHPSPPPLVCIEEPEVGLHPAVLPMVADLLLEASERTQLVVTTHSDVLISALSDVPEAVVVCERDDDGSRLRRLEPDRLKAWLEKYSLGTLWMMGETGGNP